jgi:tetratricopeptide (TPR) repeat protein
MLQKIIRDYPVFGTGGGGWAALYQGYQARPYFSSEVHNHFLQVWIEAGILGFLAFVGIWLSMAAAFVRNCMISRADSRRWQSWTAVFLPVAALGAHSFIDWNFSMAAVGIYLFTLLGAARSLDNASWFKNMFQSKAEPNKTGLSNIILLIIGIILFTGNLVLIAGFNSTARSQEYIEQRNIKMAVPELEKAIRLDPLRAENYHNLGVILEEQSRAAQSKADLEAIIFLAGRAYELEPYNPLYLFRHSEFLLNYIDVRSGLDTIDRLVIIRPLSESSYIQASLARLRLAEYYYEAGSFSEGIKYLDEIDEIASRMQERLGETEPLNFILGRVLLLRGNSTQARVLFMTVEEGDPFYELAQQQLQLLEEQAN